MQPRTVKQTTRRVKTKTSIMTPAKLTPAVVMNIEATAANTIRMTFSTRVVKSGLPGYKAGADGTETIESMSSVSETVMEFVFTGDVAGTNLLVSEGDQGIRTWPAGFVPAGSYAIPTFP
jgi:hypothetical protein